MSVQVTHQPGRTQGPVDGPAHPLHRMFAPRAIAIVGASERSGWSRFTVDNLRREGYAGPLHLVSRRGGQVHGQQALTSVAELPDGVDLLYVLTGPASLPELIEQSAERSIPNMVVIAAGFGEVGPEGAALERRLVEHAGSRGITLLGPNNLGYLNLTENVCPWSQMVPETLPRGGVGVVSQSGALGIFLLTHMQLRDTGITHLITVGNEAMVTVAECIDYLVEQPATRVIALYLESVRRPEVFLAAADRALAAGKPVVVYKAGGGETGARVAAAHTGALAGDDKVFDAVFRQHGVIRTETIEDLVTTAGLLDAYGELPGNRVGFVTSSGAMCGVISDAVDGSALEVPEFDPATVTALREGGLPDFATPQNPLDTTGFIVVKPEIGPMSERVVAHDPNIDVLVVNKPAAQTAEAAERMAPSRERFAELVATSPVPVIPMEFLPVDRSEFARSARAETGSPHVVDSLSRGVRALGRAAWWSHLRRMHRQSPPAPVPVVAPALPDAERTGTWSERDASELLALNGVPVVPREQVTSADDAVAAAERIGYPVVLKVVSADIAHKSDVGGVELGPAGPQQVREAHDRIRAAVAAAAPDARIDGVQISPLRTDGVDVLVGVVRDPVWGPTLAVALGGIWVEIMGDSALRRLPVTEQDVRDALAELRAYPLLTGARGGESVDLDALVAAATAIASLAHALGDELAELEVNPLRATADGVEALDALVRWSTGSEEPA